MSAADHPPGHQAEAVHLASEAPLARAAVVASVAGVVLGFCFLPQVLGLALGGLSLAREPRGRRHAALAIAISIALAVVWSVAIGAMLKWWVASRV